MPSCVMIFNFQRSISCIFLARESLYPHYVSDCHRIQSPPLGDLAGAAVV